MLWANQNSKQLHVGGGNGENAPFQVSISSVFCFLLVEKGGAIFAGQSQSEAMQNQRKRNLPSTQLKTTLFTISIYFILDGIACVWVRIWARGHFVMSIIRRTNLLSVNPGHKCGLMERFSIECQSNARLLWSCFISFCDWLVKLAPLFSTNEKQNQSRLARTHFPGLYAGYMKLLRILIGSLHCKRLLRLVRVIALVWFYDTQLKTAFIAAKGHTD